MDTEGGQPKNTSTRRKFVIGGAAAAVGAAASIMVGKHLRTVPEENPTPETPTPQPEIPQQQETPTPLQTPESVQIPDDGTVEYVDGLYADKTNNPSFDKETFPTKETSITFFQKIYEVAKEIDETDDDLVNKILSVINFETQGTFRATQQDPQTGETGLFGLSEANCQLLGVSVPDVLGMSPVEQADLFRKLLIIQRKTESGGIKKYNSVSDIWLAKSYPQNIGASAKDILFSAGTDAYELYKKFDPKKKGKITKGDVDEVIVESALRKGEQMEYLMDSSRRTHTMDELRKDDSESNTETEADLETATYLLKLYGDSMKDTFYNDESHALSQERKLLFFKELTRVASRLNSENENLANQITACMSFESNNAFSSYVMQPKTFATGLIQFMPDTAHDMNTSIVRLAQLTPIEQLYYVEAFLKDKGKLWEISDAYMAIFYPEAVGKDLDYIIGDQKGTKKQQDIWSENQVLDPDQTGIITKRSASEQVRQAAIKNGEKAEYLTYPSNYSPESTAS